MKITLRRAAQLQAEIERTINELNVETMVSIEPNTAEGPGTVLADCLAQFTETCAKWMELNRISTAIRASIGNANAQLGISGMLAQDAGAKKQQVFLNRLISQRFRTPELSAWTAKYAQELDALRNDVSGYRSREMSLPLVTKAFEQQCQENLKQLRRHRTELSERILAINTNNFIEVDDSDWTILELQGLV
jgi:hypothetical protein